MKTKILTNSFFTTVIYMIFLLSSCSEQQQEQQQVRETLLHEIYKDSIFLKIEGNLNEPNIIWEEVETYLQAFDRVVRHSKLENNQIILEFNSAQDINISTNIYNYIKNAFEEMNINTEKNHLELIKKGNTYIYNTLTKTDEVAYPQNKII